MQGGVNIGKYIMKTNNIKIIRSWWGDFADKFKEIPYNHLIKILYYKSN